jgi:hypothetical protein
VGHLSNELKEFWPDVRRKRSSSSVSMASSNTVSTRSVKETEGPSPFLREIAGLPLTGLPLILARATSQREGKGPQAMLQDLDTAFGTLPVGAVSKPRERVIHVTERFGLHFEQRDADLLLQVDIGRLGGVQSCRHISVIAAVLADIAELDPEIALKLAASRLEHLPQFCGACLAHDLSL